MPGLRLSILLLLGVALAASCGQPELRYPETRMRDCLKGPPKPLLNKRNRTVLTAAFQHTAFGRAEEVARLHGNVRLTIKHAGCDRVVQVFEFELKDRPRPPEDRRYWYRRSAALLKSLAPGSRSSQGLELMARYLHDAAYGAAPAFGTSMKLDDYQTLAVHLEPEPHSPGATLRVRYDFKR